MTRLLCPLILSCWLILKTKIKSKLYRHTHGLNTTFIHVAKNSEITWLTPIRTKWIFNKPIEVTIFFTITNDLNCMFSDLATDNMVVNSRFVSEEIFINSHHHTHSHVLEPFIDKFYTWAITWPVHVPSLVLRNQISSINTFSRTNSSNSRFTWRKRKTRISN